MKSAKSITSALASRKTFPSFTVAYDESRVAHRNLMIVVVASEGKLHMSPVQAVPDFTPTEHIDAAVMELAAAAATHGKTRKKKPSFVAKKTSTITVYKSLSWSLWKLFNFSFSLGIPPCPFRPVRAGEKRVKSESMAGYYIVNEQTGTNPMYT